MKKVIYCLAIMLAFCVSSFGDSIKGKVIGVSDGDTIKVLNSEKVQYKIRLGNIDAPEKAQDFGQKSKQSLSDMIFSKDVEVQISTIDKYGRVVGIVYHKGVNINLEQVKKGMAWVYRRYTNDPIFLKYEKEARDGKIGLWSHPDPINPEDFRRSKKEHGANKDNLFNKNDMEGEKSSRDKKVESEFNKKDKIIGLKADGKCGEKKNCKDITSCGEAKYYFNQCGFTNLDKNGDGVPCEEFCK